MRPGSPCAEAHELEVEQQTIPAQMSDLGPCLRRKLRAANGFAERVTIRMDQVELVRGDALRTARRLPDRRVILLSFYQH